MSSLKRTNCVTVLTPFDLQGLRLKFVSPWRLHAVSLNPASLTHYLFNVGLSVLVCERLHVLCFLSPQPRAKQEEDGTLRIHPVHKVFSLGDADMYLLLNCCILVLRILLHLIAVSYLF